MVSGDSIAIPLESILCYLIFAVSHQIIGQLLVPMQPKDLLYIIEEQNHDYSAFVNYLVQVSPSLHSHHMHYFRHHILLCFCCHSSA